MERKFWFGNGTGAAVVVAVLLIAGCGEDIVPGTTPTAPPAVVKAEVATAEITAIPEFHEAPGTISARTTATVSAKVMGEIRAIRVKEGDRVKKGDVLVEIDDSLISAALRQAQAALAEAIEGAQAAEAGLAAARASAELAQKTYKRYETLFAAESVSLQDFDEVKSRYDQAQSALSQAQAMYEAAKNRIAQARAAEHQAKTTFADATVTAPYDATVSGRLADEGDLAAPGSPLVRLESEGAAEVHLEVPESLISHVREGNTLTVVVPSLGNAIVAGTVHTVNSSANPATRAFLVKVVLPEDAGVQAGMFARVRIPVGETPMLLVPETAVVRYGQLSGVYVVDADDVARFRLMRPGRALAEGVEVIAGLKPGERFVRKVTPAVVDGVKVEAL